MRTATALPDPASVGHAASARDREAWVVREACVKVAVATKRIVDEAVESAPLFAALSDEDIAALRSSMTEVGLGRGQVLFHAGDPGERLYVVAAGKLKLSRTARDGRENLLTVLGPGDMFGELSLFDPGPRTSTATALCDGTLVFALSDLPGRWQDDERTLPQRGGGLCQTEPVRGSGERRRR